MINDYVEKLIAILKSYENNIEAEKMSQYMRGQFSYFGLRAPQMKAVVKTYIKKYGLPEEEDIPVLVKQLFLIEQREAQIVALSFMDHKLKKAAEIGDIDLLEFLITTKSWWDTVDHIATNQVGNYFKMFPNQVEKYVEKWLESGNIWLIRTAILFQLKYKNETNFNMLKDIIVRSTGTKEFFINKAIGWALREYSKVDRETVITFIHENNDRLSNLSIREGMKWVKSKKIV